MTCNSTDTFRISIRANRHNGRPADFHGEAAVALKYRDQHVASDDEVCNHVTLGITPGDAIRTLEKRVKSSGYIDRHNEECESELSMLAEKAFPLGATRRRRELTFTNPTGEKGVRRVSLKVTYKLDGTTREQSLELCTLIWDQSYNTTCRELKWGAETREFNRWLENHWDSMIANHTYAQSVASNAIKLLCGHTGMSCRNDGGMTWEILTDGKDVRISALSFMHALDLFFHDFSVNVDYSRATISDLGGLLEQASAHLDQIEQEVKDIDEGGYMDPSSEYHRSVAKSRTERLMDSLTKISLHKDEVEKLASRLSESHDRIVQVLDNQASCATSTTAHLFE